MNNRKLRLSHSIMWLWHKGDYQDAIDAIHGKWREPNQYMIDGSRYHKEWENEIKETGKMPAIFGGMELNNPKPEIKIEKQVLDWLTVVGVLDLLDLPVGYDWKTGSGTAADSARGFQHKVYKVLVPEMTRFEYHAYNQYTNTKTVEIVHLTDKTLEDGLEWIITIACDIRATLEQAGKA